MLAEMSVPDFLQARPAEPVLVHPARGEVLPIVCDSPHSGTAYPEDFGTVVPMSLLRRGEGDFTLPVLASHPWLLAAALDASADPLEQLAPQAPLIGGWPSPILGPTQVTLEFRPALPWEAPILTALPALRKIGVSGP